MKYIVSFIICLLFATTAYAEEPVIINATEDGEIVVPVSLSADDNEHVLRKLEQDTAAAVMTTNQVTTFSTLDYRNGMFDVLNSSNYSVERVLIDNNPSTYMEIAPRQQITVNFNVPVNIESMYIYTSLIRFLRYDFYLNNTKVASPDFSNYNEAQAYIPYKIKFDKLVISNPNNFTNNLMELDFFGTFEIDYIAASNVNVINVLEESATLTYNKPNSPYYVKSEVFLNGKSIYVGGNETIDLKDLTQNTEYEVKMRMHYIDGNHIDTIKTFRTRKDTVPPGVVQNLTATQKNEDVLLEYTLPTDKDFSHVRIMRNGLVINNDTTANSFTDEKVNPGIYDYRVISYDHNGNASAAVSVKITVVGFEVTQLRANTKPDQVALTWVNPNHSELQTIKIYRKNKNQSLMKSVMSLLSTNDGYTALFSTNGTKFEDLTVTSDTEYTYKVTSVIDGNESAGVMIDVKTPELKVEGGAITPQPNDYLISWTSPTTGKLKVVIAGVDYKTVNAKDLQVSIPTADMKFDKMGNYDVQLIPVDDAGTIIGVPTNPGNGGLTWGGVNLGNLGLDPKSLLLVVSALIGLIGLILLLAMSFRVTPKLIDLIKNSFR